MIWCFRFLIQVAIYIIDFMGHGFAVFHTTPQRPITFQVLLCQLDCLFLGVVFLALYKVDAPLSRCLYQFVSTIPISAVHFSPFGGQLAWPPQFLFLFAWDLCETWLRLLSMGWWGPSSGKCIRFPLVSGSFGRDLPWDKSQKPALQTTIRFDKITKQISLYWKLPMTFILLNIWFTLCFHAFIYPSIDPSLVSYQVS